MKLRNYSMLLGLLALLSVLVAACTAVPVTETGTEVETGEVAAESAATEPVEITFWHIWGGERIPLMEEAIANFEAEHPDITVNAVLQPAGDLSDLYLTALAGGDPPDLLMLYGGTYAAAAHNDQLLAVDSWIAEEDVDMDMFIECAADNAVYQGATYGLPMVLNGLHFLYWNKGIFEEAGLDPEKGPSTWAEVEELALELNTLTEGPQGVLGFDPTAMPTNSPPGVGFTKLLYTNNGELLADDGLSPAFNSPEGLEVLEWQVNMAQAQGGWEEIAGFTQGFQRPQDSFISGNAAMAISGVWLQAMLAASNPDLEYGMTILPKGPGGESRDVCLGSWILTIPKEAEHPQPAWELAKWFSFEEGHQQFFMAQLRPSMVISQNEAPFDEVYLEENPYWPTIVENMKLADSYPVTPYENEIQEVINQMVESALFGEMTPQEALAWGEEEVQKVIDNYMASE